MLQLTITGDSVEALNADLKKLSLGMSGRSAPSTVRIAFTDYNPVQDVADGDTVTIDGTVYTFKSTLTGAPYEVLIGARAAIERSTALFNLLAAVRGDLGAGTRYGLSTPPMPGITDAVNPDAGLVGWSAADLTHIIAASTSSAVLQIILDAGH